MLIDRNIKTHEESERMFSTTVSLDDFANPVFLLFYNFGLIVYHHLRTFFGVDRWLESHILDLNPSISFAPTPGHLRQITYNLSKVFGGLKCYQM